MVGWKISACASSRQMVALLGTNAIFFMFVACLARMAKLAWANIPGHSVAILLTETDRAKTAAGFGRSVHRAQPLC